MVAPQSRKLDEIVHILQNCPPNGKYIVYFLTCAAVEFFEVFKWDCPQPPNALVGILADGVMLSVVQTETLPILQQKALDRVERRTKAAHPHLSQS